MAQQRQKYAYEKGFRHTVYQPDDLVLRHTPQLKPGEAGKTVAGAFQDGKTSH